MRAAGKDSLFSWRTLVTGLAFAGLEALYWNWATGLAFTLLIYFHEAGHILAARWRGVVVTSPPTFIPGWGAFVAHRGSGSSWDQVWISLGGPVVGGAAALAVKLAGILTATPSLIFAGDFALWINLANLAPLSGLDGSRMLHHAGPLRFLCLLFLILASLLMGADAFWPVVGFGAGLYDLSQNDSRDPSLPLNQALHRVLLYLVTVACLTAAIGLTGPAPDPVRSGNGGLVLIVSLALLPILLVGYGIKQSDFPGSWLGQYRWMQHLGATLFARVAEQRSPAWTARVATVLLGLSGTLEVIGQLGREHHHGAALAAAQGCQMAFARRSWLEGHTWAHDALAALRRSTPTLERAFHARLVEARSDLAFPVELLLPMPLPLSADAAHETARSCMAAGQVQLAFGFARAAVIGWPTRARYHRTLAEVLEAYGADEAAEQHRRRASKLEAAEAGPGLQAGD
ncbi:MAG: site-2 protease family protein [Bacillota bacterium]